MRRKTGVGREKRVLIGLVAAWAAANLAATRADEPADSPVVHADVAYADRGDKPLLADVYLPPGEGPFPGVLCIHGGAWRFGDKKRMKGIARQLANNGYTAVAIDYRLAPKHVFPAQLEDCRAALRWIRANANRYHVDPKRIAVFGYSAGGHLAALLGVTDPPRAKTGDASEPAKVIGPLAPGIMVGI